MKKSVSLPQQIGMDMKFKVVGYGTPTTERIQENFDRMLVEDSIIYTDGAFLL